MGKTFVCLFVASFFFPLCQPPDNQMASRIAAKETDGALFFGLCVASAYTLWHHTREEEQKAAEEGNKGEQQNKATGGSNGDPG